MFTIALWNLERSAKKSAEARKAQQRLISAQRANLLLLTEVDRALDIEGFQGHFSDADTAESGYPPIEAASGIFHNWEAEPVRLPTREKAHLALCLRFATSPLGPLIVYCSIIPYKLWQVGGEVEVWQRHRESTERQVADWTSILSDEANAGHSLIVGGDFNQTLDGTDRYGNVVSRDLLEGAFSSKLQCLTRDDYSNVVGRHNVDHLAVDRRITVAYSWQTTPWAATLDQQRLSDHNGLTVHLEPR